MTRPRPRGFAMVSAIFLMVVLALLGALMVSLSNSQQIGATRDTLGTRAYYAARTGLEWGLYRATQGGACGTAALPNAVNATGFSVQVACVRSSLYDEGGTSFHVYQVTATASTGTPGRHDHAERQLQAVVSGP
ncbi:MAG: hypothetical protein KF891_04430 [Rhizobacter sp.]|nr:hypothetical protein [Rhizobacter sp.]